MITSIVSALTGVAVRKEVAMTGEISLRGRVMPIGGLKEKLLAALRGGLKTVLIPEGERARSAGDPGQREEGPGDRPGLDGRRGAGPRAGQAAGRHRMAERSGAGGAGQAGRGRAKPSGPTEAASKRQAKPRSDPGLPLRSTATYADLGLPFLQNMVFGVDAVFRPPLHLRLPDHCRGSPVNKHDLIAAVAASTNLSKTDAAGAIDAMLTVITKSLKKKEKVLLVGFGTFQVSQAQGGRGAQSADRREDQDRRPPTCRASRRASSSRTRSTSAFQLPLWYHRRRAISSAVEHSLYTGAGRRFDPVIAHQPTLAKPACMQCRQVSPWHPMRYARITCHPPCREIRLTFRAILWLILPTLAQEDRHHVHHVGGFSATPPRNRAHYGRWARPAPSTQRQRLASCVNCANLGNLRTSTDRHAAQSRPWPSLPSATLPGGKPCAAGGLAGLLLDVGQIDVSATHPRVGRAIHGQEQAEVNQPVASARIVQLLPPEKSLSIARGAAQAALSGNRRAPATERKALIFRALKHVFASAVCLTSP